MMMYISHEMHQVLRPLRRSIRFLHDRALTLTEDVETVDQLTSLHQQVERANRFVAQLEAFATLQSYHTISSAERIDLGAVVGHVVDDFALAEPQLTILLDIAQPITLLAEILHIELMLINLLNNAVRVTPAGGIVYVRLWSDDYRVHGAVSDSGPGLPANIQARLFTVQTPAIGIPFYGGVGLTLSNIIAQCYGGAVELHRSDASGSEFRFWLPVS